MISSNNLASQLSPLEPLYPRPCLPPSCSPLTFLTLAPACPPPALLSLRFPPCRSGAVISAEDLASQLGQSRAEAAELNARLNQFVRNSIDSMLAQRLLHDQVGG